MTYELLPTCTFSPASGVQLRYGIFEPSKNIKGTVLVIPGRREFIEKKYSEVGENLLGLGFRIIIVELRNQGLSSRVLSGAERQRDHIEDFLTHLNDLRAFFKDVVASYETLPILVHGHSQGGHIALRWLAEDRPASVKGVFMTAPMLALGEIHPALTQGLSWLNVHIGHATHYPPKIQHDFDSTDCAFENNYLTNDPERFKIIENYFTAYPDMKVGGVTWGWLLAAMKSIHITQKRDYLSQINIPVLALIGDQDRVTPVAENKPILQNISRAKIEVIAGSRHDVFNERDTVRRVVWQHTGRFLTDLSIA